MALNRLGLGLIFTAKDLASQNIGKVDKAFKSFEGNVANGTKSIAPNFKLIGAGLAAMAAGAIGLAVLDTAVDSFVGFQKAMFEVGTLTNATTEEIERLSAETLRLSSEFGLDNQEAAKTFYQIISAGTTDATEATKLFEVANRLAIAGVTTSTTAVDVLTSVMGAYGLSAADAEGISDTLFTTMKLGKTTIGELGASMGQVVPFAAQLGVSFDEVGAAVSALAGVSGTTSEVVTGMTAVLGAFIKPTSEGEKIAKKFGFELSAATVRAKGLAGTLDLLANVAEKDEGALAKLLGRKEALRVLLPLIGARAQAFTDNLAAMGNKAGTTRKGFELMTQTLDFSLKKLDALKKNVFTLVGEALAPFVAVLVEIAQKVFQAFTILPKPIQKFISVMLLAGSVALIAGGALLILLGFLPAITAGFGLAAGAAGTFWSAVLLPILPVIAGIALAGLAFGGFIFLVKKNFGGLGDFFGKIFQKVSLVFKTLAQVFTKGEISGAVLDELLLIENKGIVKFVGLVVSTVARVQAFFKGMISGIKSAFSGFVPIFKAIGSVVGSLIKIGTTLLGVFGVDIPTSVGGSLSGFEKFGKIVGFLISVVFQPMLVIISLVAKAISFVAGKFESFVDTAGSAARKVGGFLFNIPGIGASLVPASFAVPASSAPGPGLVEQASPAAAAASGAADVQRQGFSNMSAAMQQGSGAPIVVQSNITLDLDGEQVANVVAEQAAVGRVKKMGTPLPNGG